MCIVFLEYSPDGSGTYQLIVAVNRDEFYDRNTLPAHFWPHPASHIIAGIINIYLFIIIIILYTIVVVCCCLQVRMVSTEVPGLVSLREDVSLF